MVAEENAKYEDSFSKEEIMGMIEGLEEVMLRAAEQLDFEKAAEIRDRIIELKGKL